MSQLVRHALSTLRLLATDRRSGLRRVSRSVGLLRAAIVLRDCERGELVFAGGEVRVGGRGAIRLGDRVQVSGGIVPSELRAAEGAVLSIGAHTFLNYGVTLLARERILIGAHCLLGSMVEIQDREGAPVTIGDDVWIAHGAIVHPGVSVGSGSVVSAGSVVTEDVPPGHLAVGSPATCVPLEEKRRGEWRRPDVQMTG